MALLLCPLLAVAQIVPERELEVVKSLFNNGNYPEALKRANDAMAVANFSEPQRIELLRIAGLSAFNLNEPERAKRDFYNLLVLDPDYQLDPFAVPPPAIKAFEQVRRDNADALNLVRQQIATRLQQEKKAREDQEKAREKELERLRRLEELSREITVRTVERRSMLVNFIPFGAGQFQQNRVGWGITFAVSEAVTALTSVIAFFAIESLYQPITYTWTDRLTAAGTGTFSVTVNQIPQARKNEASTWSAIKFTSGALFYALWAAGVGDALYHHQGDVVTQTKEAAPKVSVDLHLTPGGALAGLTFSF